MNKLFNLFSYMIFWNFSCLWTAGWNDFKISSYLEIIEIVSGPFYAWIEAVNTNAMYDGELL